MSFYLHGIMAATDALPPDVPGIHAEAHAQALDLDGLRAVVSTADADAIRQAAATVEHDPAPLQALALRHEATISALLRVGTVLPVGFGILLPDAEMVVQLLRTQAPQWRTLLNTLDGCIEMGLKAYADSDALLALFSPADEPNAANTGLNYLLQKQQQRSQQHNAEAHLNAQLGALHETCLQIAQAAVIKPIDRQLTALTDEDDLVLRSIYLLPRTAIADLRQLVSAFEDQAGAWLTVTLDGPFAPYHFVHNAESEPEA